MSIELHIERLVIDAAVLGGERVDDVRAAIERELGHSLARPGTADVLQGIGRVAALSATKPARAAQSSESCGMRIASAVLQGLGLPAATGHEGGTRHG